MSEPSLEQLLADHGRFVRSLAGEVLGDRHLAEDVVQEAWLRGHHSRLHVPGAYAWLRTVVHNLSRNLRTSELARQRREQATARQEKLASTLDEMQRAELVTRIAKAVQSLPEPYRSVILMRFWDGLQPREIARKQGLPLPTVKSQLQRGLGRLRGQLSDSHDKPFAGLAALALPHAAHSRPVLIVKATLMQTKAKLVTLALIVSAIGVVYWPRMLPTPHTGLGPSGSTEGVAFEDSDSQDVGSSDRAPMTATAAGAVRTSAQLSSASTAAVVGNVRITGRVLDDAGALVQGAQVSLRPPGMATAQHLAATDALGRYELVLSAVGTYLITVEASGCIPLQARLALPVAEEHEIRDLILSVGRCVRGLIVDEEGAGIAAAEIVLIEQPNPFAAVQVRELTHSDADGSFASEGLSQSGLTLGITAQGFVPHTAKVPPSATQAGKPWVLVLTRGWSARIHVKGATSSTGELRATIAPATGSSLANSEVDWSLHTRRKWPFGSQRMRDVDALAPDTAYYVRLEEQRPNGTWRKCSELSTIRVEHPEASLSYTALATVSIEARDARSGMAVLDFEVFGLENSRYWKRYDAAPTYPATDKASGAMLLEVIPGKELTLRVMADGYASAELDAFTCLAGERHDLPIVDLQPARTLTVVVRDAISGELLEGARLRTREQQAPPAETQWSPVQTTDQRGRANLSIRAGEDTLLAIERDGYVAWQATPFAETPQSELLSIDLQPAAQALVHVLDTEGAPVPDIAVACKPMDDQQGQTHQGISDIAGRVLFSDLAPGEHSFSLVPRDFIGRRIMMGGSIAQVSIGSDTQSEESLAEKLQAGRLRELTLVVPVRCTLAGHVYEAGVPVVGAGLHALEQRVGLENVMGIMDLGEASVVSSADGAFEFSGLAQGQVTLIVQHPMRSFAFSLDLDLHRDLRKLRVDLPLSGLRGTIRGADGAPLGNAQVKVVVAAPDGSLGQSPRFMTVDAAGIYSMSSQEPASKLFMTDATGQFEIKGAPPGYTLRVEASAPDGISELRTLILAEDEMRELEFTLEPAGSLAITLSMRDGSTPRNNTIKLHWKGQGQEPSRDLFLGFGSRRTFTGLRPGPWELVVQSFTASSTFSPVACEVRASETTACPVVLEL